MRERARNRAELIELTEAWMATFATDQEVLDVLEAHRVPCAPVLRPTDALGHPYFIEREMVRTVPDPVLGEVTIPGFPFKFSERPDLPELRTASLGEHNADVLGGWAAYEDDRVAGLAARRRAVRPRPRLTTKGRTEMTTTQDERIAKLIANGYGVRVEPCPHRVRAVVAGEAVADSTRALYLYETRHAPVWYVPIEDVRGDLLEATDHTSRCPFKGDARYWSIVVGGERRENAVWGYPEPIETCPDISRHVAFFWDRVDAWYEDDEQVEYIHPPRVASATW